MFYENLRFLKCIEYLSIEEFVSKSCNKDEESPGFIRFDESLDIDWFEQLGAEEMGRTYQRGQLTHTFKPVPGRRNEALNCMAYNVATLAVLNVRNWDYIEKEAECTQPSGNCKTGLKPDERRTIQPACSKTISNF